MPDNNVKYALLGLISARPDGIHGYGLREEVQALSGRDFWEINFGSLYRILDLMAQSGEIELLGTPETGKTTRKLFRITSKGKQTLDDWLLLPVDDAPRPLRDELALKLLFITPDRLEVLGEQIRRQRSIYMGQLNRLIRNKRRLEKAGFDARITKLVMEGGESRLLADLEWLDVIERKLLRITNR